MRLLPRRLRSRRSAPACLLLGCATLLGSVGCGAGSPAADTSQEVASAFLTDIREGRIDQAWNQATSAEFKSVLGLEGLRGYAREYPVLQKQLRFSSSENLTQNGMTLTECTFESPETPARVKILLGISEGEVKVERLSVE